MVIPSLGECRVRFTLVERPRGLHKTLPQSKCRQRGLFRRRLPAEGTDRLTRQAKARRYSGDHEDPTGYPDKHSGKRTSDRPALLASTAMQLFLSRLDVCDMSSEA